MNGKQKDHFNVDIILRLHLFRTYQKLGFLFVQRSSVKVEI